MTRKANAPYSWDDVEAEVRECILAQASIIAAFGPDNATVSDAFLGFETTGNPFDPTDINDPRAQKFDITRHRIFGIAERAFKYAYQLEGWTEATDEDFHEVACGLLNGYARSNVDGSTTSLYPENDAPLRRVLETFLARWRWKTEAAGLTARELGLLANMAEQTVRSSLSKEGFRMSSSQSGDDARAELSAGDALQWLSRRRGFIPNRGGVEPILHKAVVSDILENEDRSALPIVIARILEAVDLAPEALARGAQVSEHWLEGLLKGEAVAIDIEALKRVADAIGAHRPTFVGFATRYLVWAEDSRGAAT